MDPQRRVPSQGVGVQETAHMISDRNDAHPADYKGRHRTIKVRAYNESTGKHYSWRIPRSLPERKQFLDQAQMFQCAECRLYVSWDYGADVGLPGLEPTPPVGRTLRRAIPSGATLEERDRLRLDEHLRECCDGCWDEITEQEKR